MTESTSDSRPELPKLPGLQGFDARAFLAEYWQRKPFVMRQVAPWVAGLIDGDTLAGLACEPDIQSRLVRRIAQRWELRVGPFEAEDFATLPSKDWTLLVQAVDHWVPTVTNLRNCFRFLPDWRLDDVMASYAAPGGGVGPHYDQYDVFLIQAEGHRHWRYGGHYGPEAALQENCDIRLLADFRPQEEAVLGPGDILYLPPGIGHEGIACDDCLTLSVGFRAPAIAEILTELSAHLAGRYGDADRFVDPSPEYEGPPGQIPAQAVEQIQQIALNALQDRQAVAEWLGRFMTEPVRPTPIEPIVEEAAVILAAKPDLCPHPASRLAFVETAKGIDLFADGECWHLDPVDRPFAALICGPRPIRASALAGLRLSPAALQTLHAWVGEGRLLPVE